MVVRWVALLVVLAATGLAERNQREKRQVTYHGGGHHESAEDEDNQSILPATKKPLPFRVVYPGDLSSFYTTDSPNLSRKDNNESSSIDGVPLKRNRIKRSEYLRRRDEYSKRNMKNPSRISKSSRHRDVQPMESRLHSSYHKPSVSIMNDVPVEMSFNGAGFLRHEDEDFENENRKSRNSGSRPKTHRNKNHALDDFRNAFNVTRERVPSQVQFDDDAPHQGQVQPFQASEGTGPDYGTQGAENGTPLSVDYMAAYQNAFQNPYQGMFDSTQFNFAPTQTTQAPPTQQYDPFSFNYASMFGGQTNVNQMMPQPMQQDTFMQNHRIPQMPNPSAMPNQAMYSPVQHQQQQQQAFAVNPMFTQPTPNPQQTHKTQKRRKRSIQSLLNVEDSSASHLTQDHYGYAQVEDQHDAGSAFIPISGNFNGGTIQLNIPFYGQNPIIQPNYPHRQQMHGPYSSQGSAEGRHYGGSGERFYHPSEARRYSYGVLGSGNFEVIRGGLFPGERQQSYRGGGYQSGRMPYGGDEWNNNNYGTTEIIIDGPIQGFQGFDNFQLINALSKHSEIAIRPEDRHDSN